MEITKQLIDRVLLSKSTMKSWRNKHQSIEWREANAVNKALFADTFSKSYNCGCVEDFFYLLELKVKKQEITKIMDKKFILKKGKVIMSHGCDIVTEHSTDARCIALLRTNKKHASKFESLPENWEEIVDKKESKPKAKRTKKKVVAPEKLETNEVNNENSQEG